MQISHRRAVTSERASVVGNDGEMAAATTWRTNSDGQSQTHRFSSRLFAAIVFGVLLLELMMLFSFGKWASLRRATALRHTQFKIQTQIACEIAFVSNFNDETERKLMNEMCVCARALQTTRSRHTHRKYKIKADEWRLPFDMAQCQQRLDDCIYVDATIVCRFGRARIVAAPIDSRMF